MVLGPLLFLCRLNLHGSMLCCLQIVATSVITMPGTSKGSREGLSDILEKWVRGFFFGGRILFREPCDDVLCLESMTKTSVV